MPWHLKVKQTQPEFRTVAECEKFVRKVTRSKLWRERAPWYAQGDRVKVRDGRGRRSACANSDDVSIALPRWARSKPVILHELAHLAVPDHVAAHGEEFAAAFVVLVREFMGVEDARRLITAFKDLRVRYR